MISIGVVVVPYFLFLVKMEDALEFNDKDIDPNPQYADA
jgi:hypothetical protein